MASPSSQEIAALRDSIETLTQHVQLVWNVLDEIRRDVEWAVQNDKGIVVNINVVAETPALAEPAAPKEEKQPRPQGPPGQLF